MSRLSPIHWQVFEKFLLRVGCQFVKQKGSHRKYNKAGLSRPVIVTVHGQGIIPKDHVKSNLKTLGIGVEEYLKIVDDL